MLARVVDVSPPIRAIRVDERDAFLVTQRRLERLGVVDVVIVGPGVGMKEIRVRANCFFDRGARAAWHQPDRAILELLPGRHRGSCDIRAIRPNQYVDLVRLDELVDNRNGQRIVGLGVGHEEFDLAAIHGIAPNRFPHRERLLNTALALDAVGDVFAGKRRGKADLEGLLGILGLGRNAKGAQGKACQHGLAYTAHTNTHWSLLLIAGNIRARISPRTRTLPLRDCLRHPEYAPE